MKIEFNEKMMVERKISAKELLFLHVVNDHSGNAEPDILIEVDRVKVLHDYPVLQFGIYAFKHNYKGLTEKGMIKTIKISSSIDWIEITEDGKKLLKCI